MSEKNAKAKRKAEVIELKKKQNDEKSQGCFSTCCSLYATGYQLGQINIGSVWKDVQNAQLNVGDSWKSLADGKENITDVWKNILH